MIETCKHCGKTWGVTMTPRSDIACHDCQFHRPDLYPARYWQARLDVLHFHTWPFWSRRSVESRDADTSLADLEYAVECAEKMEASR